LLPGQPEAEPDGGSGAFLVVNDTGKVVTSPSITIVPTFRALTPSVAACTGLQTGNLCDNFQDNKGALAGSGGTETLSGPTIDSCTSSTSSGTLSCTDNAGGVAANFASGPITYTWTGLDIPSCNPSVPGNCTSANEFEISFASWNNSAAIMGTPEPSSLALLASGLLGLVGFARRKLNS
jgi:hypothetical protein